MRSTGCCMIMNSTWSNTCRQSVLQWHNMLYTNWLLLTTKELCANYNTILQVLKCYILQDQRLFWSLFILFCMFVLLPTSYAQESYNLWLYLNPINPTTWHVHSIMNMLWEDKDHNLSPFMISLADFQVILKIKLIR